MQGNFNNSHVEKSKHGGYVEIVSLAYITFLDRYTSRGGGTVVGVMLLLEVSERTVCSVHGAIIVHSTNCGRRSGVVRMGRPRQ